MVTFRQKTSRQTIVSRGERAFTLVELLIVVVVIVTLMMVTFRISGVGDDANKRNYTINRMQRLENCLSGYYAAYGSYPPVKLHGSRDYLLEVNGQGIQQTGSSGGNTLKGGNQSSGSAQHIDKISEEHWDSVEAACRCQPVGMGFPFKDTGVQAYIRTTARLMQKYANSSEKKYEKYRARAALKYGFDAITDNSMLSGKQDDEDWSQVQIFKLGLMSYLLPRYLIVMGGDNSNMNQLFEKQRQWTSNNQIPCQFESGVQYASWTAFNDDARNHSWKVAVLPSQIVCARWLPNLTESLATSRNDVEVYGIKLRDRAYSGNTSISAENANIRLYSAADSQGGSGKSYSQQYVLDCITMCDGWDQELYYYSLPPHQTYMVWSSGPNARTFPPWVTDEELKALKTDERELVEKWISDDIRHMSH